MFDFNGHGRDRVSGCRWAIRCLDAVSMLSLFLIPDRASVLTGV